MASESLFRMGIVSSLSMYTIFIFYAMILYRLLKPDNTNHALLMLVLALIGVCQVYFQDPEGYWIEVNKAG